MKQHTAALLEQHFDTAFASLEGVARLRELILTLAMQGKLVEQDPKDQPARELLEEIKRTRRHEGTKGRKRKELPPVSAEEMPYELPESWEWTRLGEIGNWRSGSTPSRSNSSFYGGGIPWVKSGEVKQGRIASTEESITSKALEQCSLHINSIGSILVAMYGANIGEVGVLEIEAATNQAVCACQTYTQLNELFLLNLIQTLKPYFLSLGAGAAQPNISRQKIIGTPIPLPPLAEQQRIVAKIDELMARCDALEALHQQHEEKRLHVHTAAIHQLLEPNLGGFVPSCEPFDFLAKHFSELYSVPENVTELRKAILQLAVMGRLVPQNPDDPPASQLLEEIRTEKKRLIAEGKIKKQKPLPAIKPEEIPYEIPEDWEWVRLEDVSRKIHYGYTASADHNIQNIRLLRITDIQENKVDWGTVPGCNARKEDVAQYLLAENDILIARTGGTVGKSYLVQGINVDAVFASYLIRVVPSNRINVRFIKYFAESHLYWAQLYAACSGTGQPNVNGTSLSQLILTLPPLPEQHHIVAKIDQLMSLCDQLDEQIIARNEKQTELLNAVMGQV